MRTQWYHQRKKGEVGSRWAIFRNNSGIFVSASRESTANTPKDRLA